MSLSNLSEKLRARQEAVAAKKNNVTNAIRNVSNGVSNAKSAVNGVVNTAGTTFNQIGNLGKTFTGIKDTAMGTITGVKDTVTGAVGGAKDAVNGVIGDANKAVTGIKSTVAGTIGEVQKTAGNVAKAAGSMVGGVQNSAQKIGDSFGNAFGGSNDIATKSVKASGSGDAGASPGNRMGVFATDPTSVLPSLDPLKREVSKPFEAVNAQADEVMSYLSLDKAGEALSSGWDSLVNLASEVENTVAPIKDRIEQTMDMVGAVASLPDQIMGQVSNIVNSAQEVEAGVRASIDGVAHTFKSFKSLAHFGAVNQFISDYAAVDREQDLLDVEALRALIMSMGQSMISEGQQEKIEELITRIPDPAIREQIYDDLLLVAAEVGYVSGVEYYQQKISAGHGPLVADRVVNSLFANLDIQRGESYKDVGQRLLAVLGKLKSDWNMNSAAKRVELWPYTLCNGNAMTALLTTDHAPYVVAGGCVVHYTPNAMSTVFFPLRG